MCLVLEQVVIPLSLQRRVEGLLQEYLDRLQLNSEKLLNNVDDASPTKNFDINDIADSFVDESVMEKVLMKRSMRMRNMQRSWQVFFFFFGFLNFFYTHIWYCCLN